MAGVNLAAKARRSKWLAALVAGDNVRIKGFGGKSNDVGSVADIYQDTLVVKCANGNLVRFTVREGVGSYWDNFDMIEPPDFSIQNEDHAPPQGLVDGSADPVDDVDRETGSQTAEHRSLRRVA